VATIRQQVFRKIGYQVDLHVGKLENTYNSMGEKMGEFKKKKRKLLNFTNKIS
jgi:hypothetical protein